ncbi:hypothetical protein Taro_055744 [Colocasia esculenta]|uniref:Uncharacterized protein n=1 Tax=Colocasia esculenta TaxID=4460 RepID=A0A843XRR6_COLES|nr:hypothetical protein [Colocasia esculenta]
MGFVGLASLAVLSGFRTAPDYCFRNLFLGADRGGTDDYVSLTSWRVRDPRVRAEGCLRIVSDSAGSTGVMSGLILVVGRGVTLFRCFVVLYNRKRLRFPWFWIWKPTSNGRIPSLTRTQTLSSIKTPILGRVRSFRPKENLGFPVVKTKFRATLIRRLGVSSGDLHRLGGALDIGEASPTPVCDLHRHKDQIWEDFGWLLGLAEEGILG